LHCKAFVCPVESEDPAIGLGFSFPETPVFGLNPDFPALDLAAEDAKSIAGMVCLYEAFNPFPAGAVAFHSTYTVGSFLHWRDKMSANGIWKIEMLGPYGWESTATAFMQDGKYQSGSRNHYTVGSYEISGNNIEVSGKYVTHGEARTMFGKQANQMELRYKGVIDGDQINGQAFEDDSSYQVTFRATRLAGLP
jgi:hypothetical protein